MLKQLEQHQYYVLRITISILYISIQASISSIHEDVDLAEVNDLVAHQSNSYLPTFDIGGLEAYKIVFGKRYQTQIVVQRRCRRRRQNGKLR